MPSNLLSETYVSPVIYNQPNIQPLDKVSVLYQAISDAETMKEFKAIYKAIELEKFGYQIKSKLFEAWDRAKIKKGFIYNDEN
jgi:hypothetical protein